MPVADLKQILVAGPLQILVAGPLDGTRAPRQNLGMNTCHFVAAGQLFHVVGRQKCCKSPDQEKETPHATSFCIGRTLQNFTRMLVLGKRARRARQATDNELYRLRNQKRPSDTRACLIGCESF